MLKNYLTVALRTLRRNRGYTLINVGGLAVGLACCLLIGLYVQDERSYDRFHEKAGRIHRLVAEGYAAVGPPVAGALKTDFPGLVEDAARLWPIQNPSTLRHEGKAFVERRVSFADPSVFAVFSYPMRAGDSGTALEAPFSMVVTASVAQKYFGDGDPLGRTVEMWGRDFEVTGVIADVPAQTHYPLDVLVSLSSLPSYLSEGMMDNWQWAGFYTYALLHEGASAKKIEAALPAFYARHTSDPPADPRLQALTSIHLHSDLDKEAAPPGNAAYVYLLATVAALVLVLACVNFMNLSTARSVERAKEVGMRKTVGATRRQIAAQFLGEAVLLAVAALALALLLVQAALPLFGEVAGKDLALRYDAGTLLTLLGLVGIVGLGAGSYPALFLSGFAPTSILRGDLPSRFAGAGLRRTLVGVQLALSVGLLVGAGVVQQQFSFLKNKDLGFDKERIVVVEAANYDALREELRDAPGIASVSASSGVPGERFQTLAIHADGMPVDSTRSMRWLGVDYGFFETMGIERTAGRFFSKTRGTDTERAFIINEAAAHALGWRDPVGKQIAHYRFGEDGATLEVAKEGEVVGVTRDFHYASLHGPVEPLVMSVASGEDLNLAVLRLRGGAKDGAKGGRAKRALGQIEAAWTRVNPGDSYFHFFLDDFTAQQYRAEQQLSRVFGGFTALALFVACLGLFGLAAFAAEQRRKEIGIRRVLGASTASVVGLLSKEFAALVGVAFAVAAPLAYLGARWWLGGFAYRVELGPGVFAGAGALVLAVTLATAAWHAWRAARTNPAQALRDE
jgi:putative ABC transport system permease protein